MREKELQLIRVSLETIPTILGLELGLFLRKYIQHGVVAWNWHCSSFYTLPDQKNIVNKI